MALKEHYEFDLKKIDFESLDEITQKALHEAVEVRKKAFSNYSNFQVGSSVVTEDDVIFTGCNVENVTYKGICAEQTAFCKAVSEGKKRFKTVAVIAHQENGRITSPCGTCRQHMIEFGDINVYMSNPDLKAIYFCKLSDLLPLSFVFDPNKND
ncbi:hypothetical protein FQR65_LT08125 [Abscondita terminalis]|nr:hypothetical protein FQR65_LT08125 [Abscondita terminalis]